MRLRRLAVFSSMVAIAAIALAGCAAPTPRIVEGSRLTIAVPGPFTSANSTTSLGTNTANEAVAELTASSFSRENGVGALVNNASFGSVQKVSDNPLKVKYTLSEKAVWSDGVAVDASDLLLAWAANSGALNTVAAKRDADGTVTNQDALNKGVYFDSNAAGSGLNLVTQPPKISDDNRAITLTFTHPFADWERVFPEQLIAAHVVMQHAMPARKYSADAAKRALVTAVQNDDAGVLNPVSIFWNHGFDMTNLPSDGSLLVSSGPYVVTGAKENDSVTLTANEHFAAGPLPRVQTITLRLISDPLERAKALAAGDVDMMTADATAPLLAALHDAKNVTLLHSPASAYEHLDLSFASGGPFDPKAWGGDASRARKAREAFLLTVPRAAMLDTLIKPLQPKPAVRDSFMSVPGADAYDDIVDGNDSSRYAAVNLVRARSLLASIGATKPLTVRLLYPASDALRSAEFAQIVASAAQAGFRVTDASSAGWKQRLGDSSYDAALFAWDAGDASVNASESIFGTDGARNLNAFSNPNMDALFEQLDAEYSADKRKALMTQVEKQLFDDAYGLPLYQLPSVTAVDSTVISGVGAQPALSMLLGEYADWKPSASSPAPR